MGSALARGMSYGFGTFGDERLKKGGPCCIEHLSVSRVHASAGLGAADVLKRYVSRGFCGILQ